LGTVEKRMIEKALGTTGGNKTEAAKKLGITLRSLRYRLSKHSLEGESDNGSDYIFEESMN